MKALEVLRKPSKSANTGDDGKIVARSPDKSNEPMMLAGPATKDDKLIIELGLDGKLKIGPLAHRGIFRFNGGEFPLYRLGATGVGITYCETGDRDCLSEIAKKFAEIDGLLARPNKRANPPVRIEFPE
jgi:hypothetical protein